MATTKRSSGGTRKSTATRSRASASKAASGTGSAKKRTTTGTASGSNAKTARAGTGSRNGAKRSQKTTAAARATASRNGSSRSSSQRSRARAAAGSRNGSTRSGGSTRARAASARTNGATGTLREKGSALLRAADKANGPAITVAAAVAGLAGGLVLRQRPRLADAGIAERSRHALRDVDPTAVMEGVGKAAAHLGKRSKVIARELDHVADRAERLGKILS